MSPFEEPSCIKTHPCVQSGALFNFWKPETVRHALYEFNFSLDRNSQAFPLLIYFHIIFSCFGYYIRPTSQMAEFQISTLFSDLWHSLICMMFVNFNASFIAGVGNSRNKTEDTNSRISVDVFLLQNFDWNFVYPEIEKKKTMLITKVWKIKIN